LSGISLIIYVVGYGSAFLLLAGAIFLLSFGDFLNNPNAHSDGNLLLALGITVLAIDIVITAYSMRNQTG
jgi:hypothetical protein